MDITVETGIAAPVGLVWRMFNEPADILAWDASDDWCTTSASNDLRVGGRLQLRIEPRNGGAGIDFGATYTEVRTMEVIAWRTDQGQTVRVLFGESSGVTHVRQTFEAEPEPSIEAQRADWQGVLDGFARHVEARSSP